MSKKTNFIVTEKAGIWVAGKRSPGTGKTIPLTEDQAKYSLIAGEIERPKPASAKPKGKRPDKPEAEGSGN